MTFQPPRQPTRFPPLLVFAISVAAIGAIAGGVFILLFDPFDRPESRRIGSEEALQAAEELPLLGEDVGISRPARITIPAIGVDGPVLEMRLGPDGLWDAESIIGEVGHLQGTPLPGEDGNAALAAHVTVPGGAYGPFKDLEALEPGNAVSIWSRDGTLYNFEVTENKEVLATAIEVLNPTAEPTLTLITCSGWDHNQETYLERIVVTARLTEVVPPQ